MAGTRDMTKPEGGTDIPRPLSTMLRVVTWGVLISLLWKFSYFIAGVRIYLAYPIRDDFFPSGLQNAYVFLLAYGLALVGAVGSLFQMQRPRLLICQWITSLSLFVLCIHQHSFNDMTFLTTFWTSLWLLWLGGRVGVESVSSLSAKAVFLSHFVLGMVLLGGAVGKMTPGYWSGEVMYEIYFVKRDFWVFNQMRQWGDYLDLQMIARIYSRAIIMVESFCGFIWLLPPRWASWVAITVLSGIAIFSNFFLFSVLSCLIGLALVGLICGDGNSER
jgi:hypothetical protein